MLDSDEDPRYNNTLMPTGMGVADSKLAKGW